MNFLRNLFARSVPAPQTAQGHAAVLAAPAPAPAPAAIHSPAAPSAPLRMPALETGKPSAATPVASNLTFPLKSITDLFGPDLLPALHKQPSPHVEISVPREWIAPQLAKGAIRIPFAQLKSVTPEVFFNPDAVSGEATVLLPLESVLRQFMPARRPDQLPHVVPVNVPPLFSKTPPPPAHGAHPPAHDETWYSHRRVTYTGPSAQEPAPAESASRADRKPAAAPTPQPASARAAEGARPAPRGAAIEQRPTRPASPACSFVEITVAALLDAFPLELRHAIRGTDLEQALLRIPVAAIEPGMRIGKLSVCWQDVRDWCTAPLPSPAQPQAPVHLPLSTLVPLFLAARGGRPVERETIRVNPGIPQVFSRAADAPAPVAETGPETPAAVEAGPESAAPSVSTPAPEPASGPAVAPLPTAREAATAPAGPAHWVDAVCALPRVTGAFLATTDGLLVAGKIAEGNENVFAAFAPTVFTQLAKYAEMARLGSPDSLQMNLQAASVYLGKAGKLFLGVVTPPGQMLSAAELTRIHSFLHTHQS